VTVRISRDAFDKFNLKQHTFGITGKLQKTRASTTEKKRNTEEKH
jgi:hypothetical protein